MKKLLILIIASTLFASASYGQGKNSKLEKAIIDEVFDKDEKGGGKPGNPGAHGRANAEYKKATNPGKGGGKNSSIEGALLGELLDDDDDKKKGKDKGKNKKK
jgi:hypothetical protein